MLHDPTLTELADSAREAIDAIADGLRTAYADDVHSDPQKPDVTARRASLESGRAGAAVFFAQRAAASNDEADWAFARRLLDDALAVSIPSETSGLLHHGSVGVAWSLTHLRQQFGIEATDADAAAAFVLQTDAALLDRVSVTPWTGDYDLIVGLVGFGLYALERLPAPSAVMLLEQIVARLDELSEHTPDGTRWWTPPALTGWPDETPDGYYNLGVAHGVPGVIGLLAQVIAEGVAVNRAQRLYDGAVRWLLAQRLPPETGCHFPAWIQPGLAPSLNRQTWCYGDLGIASTLAMAAALLHDASLRETAHRLAVSIATQPYRPETVDEALLCHGAFGNAHLFRRLHQTLGDERLKTAAAESLARGLTMRRPGGMLGGFSVVEPDKTGRQRRIAYRGLLNGAAGIGLALLAATTSVEPAWDRLLLLSPVTVPRHWR